jgi:hypothetical protein
MDRAGSQNAEWGMRNAKWKKRRIQAFIPNSEIRIPNLHFSYFFPTDARP